MVMFIRSRAGGRCEGVGAEGRWEGAGIVISVSPHNARFKNLINF